MIKFHDTVYGRRFFDGQLPELIRNLGRIADCMEREQERQVCVKETSEGVDLSQTQLEEVVGGLASALGGDDSDYIEVLTDSINKAAGKKVVGVVSDDADIWMGTWLFTQGGSEGRWERYYFKNGTRQEVEDWMWGHDKGGEAVGVYVEAVDFEIDVNWDIIDLRAEGWSDD